MYERLSAPPLPSAKEATNVYLSLGKIEFSSQDFVYIDYFYRYSGFRQLFFHKLLDIIKRFFPSLVYDKGHIRVVNSYYFHISKFLSLLLNFLKFIVDFEESVRKKSIYWSLDKLTKPIFFVVDNSNWSIRHSLLSAPLVPALCLSSRDLL